MPFLNVSIRNITTASPPKKKSLSQSRWLNGRPKMKRKSNSLAYLKKALWKRAMAEKDPLKRKDLRMLHQKAQDAEDEIDEIVRDAEMMGIRNPAFPDDLVGWLDDDFELPEDRWKRYGKPDNDEDEDKK